MDCYFKGDGNPTCAGVAQVTKYEDVETYNDEGESQHHRVPLKICRSCNEYWYDGTEEYPGVKPL